MSSSAAVLAAVETVSEAIRRAKRRSTSPIELVQASSFPLTAFAVTYNVDERLNCLRSRGLYARQLLNDPDDDHQIVLAIWPPGSSSPIHAHDELTGLVTACVGRTVETKYTVVQDRDGECTLERGDTIELTRGRITPIYPGRDLQLHEMTNNTTEWAATLHVYFEPLMEFVTYEPTSDRPLAYRKIQRELWFD